MARARKGTMAACEVGEGTILEKASPRRVDIPAHWPNQALVIALIDPSPLPNSL